MPQRLANRSVLLVEDEFLILLDLEHLLQSEGARVTTASDLRDGLDVVERAFDAAVLDVRLPDGDVFPLAERLQERGVPLVFHSGHAQAEEVLGQFPAAVALAKPAAERVLIDAVARLSTGRGGDGAAGTGGGGPH